MAARGDRRPRLRGRHVLLRRRPARPARRARGDAGDDAGATATADPAATGDDHVVGVGHSPRGRLPARPTRRSTPKRIAVVGHSRLGKTALLAGAFDERIALVDPQPGRLRRQRPRAGTTIRKAETVAIITKRFPHWFCGNFKEFDDDPSQLPFDQHCLVALCAPRPVLFTNAADDVWANPSGQFEVLQAARPAYELLGVEGLAAEKMPAPGDALVASRLGYWIRPGEHAMSRRPTGRCTWTSPTSG